MPTSTSERPPTNGWRVIGVDVGGTFTDCVALGPDGGTLLKVATDRDDPAAAVAAAVAAIDPGGDAAVVHGSTVATNALLERRGARTAFVTTAGFGDLLALGRGARADLYALAPAPLVNLVGDGDVVEVPERVDALGGVVRPLSPGGAARIARAVHDRDVQAVAVCLLFAYLATAHEDQLGRALVRRRPAPFVSLSSQVMPEFREYERATATVVNAYVAPRTTGYLDRLRHALAGRSFSVMGSHGGTLSPAYAASLPVTMVLSGPAAGVSGALAIAARAGVHGLLTLDMGGTSTDVAVADDGLPMTSEVVLGGLPIQRQMVDVQTVGAGGGSLLAVDAGGALRVGPESAGAAPGPAAYGRGGAAATLTDAHVVLGRLPAGLCLGGAPIDADAARRAVAVIAAQLGVHGEVAARIALDVADAVVERALRTVAVWRGIDPSARTLVAFGGAGPLHACRLAERLSMDRILIPAQAGALSAFGLAVAQPAVSLSRGVAASATARSIRDAFQALEDEAGGVLRGLTGASPLAVERSADVRYASQSWTLPVPWPAGGRIEGPFAAVHRARYGFTLREAAVVVTLRVRAVGAPPPLGRALRAAGETPAMGSAECVLDDGRTCAVPVVDRATLAVGDGFAGPAIVLQRDATTWVADGWRAHVGPHFDLHLERG
ncbi:MAG: hydantoinase/oxoprolinase family protein [Ardenticatenales bacterium]